jgi:hypothetical protein
MGLGGLKIAQRGLFAAAVGWEKRNERGLFGSGQQAM